MNLTTFQNPPADYRGVTLWMLNDRLDSEHLRTQIKGIRDAGFGAVITRTFVGLRTEYLSDEWMAGLKVIVSEARKLGMKVFFQAGYMPSAIPKLEERFAHEVVGFRKKNEALCRDETVLFEDEKSVYFKKKQTHVLDMFNREAVKDYIKGAYEDTWFEKFEDDFGRTIESVWVDEPHFAPPFVPWGDMLLNSFKETWGYAIEDNVPALFGKGTDSQRVKHHFWRTVTKALLDCYFHEISEWCEKHNVSFSGHLMGEDTLFHQTCWTGGCMPLYEKMHIPGIDHLTLSLSWQHGSNEGTWDTRFIMTPKQCSSAANQFGRGKILAEMYAVSTQGITFEERKRIGDWFALLGINYRCIHGTFYSMRGRRKRIYAPHISYQQPWWNDNALMGDYYARLGYALRQGTFDADVLVLHSLESGYCLYNPFGESKPLPTDMYDLNKSLSLAGENLMKIHRGFEYGDEHILSKHGSVSGRRICVGQMEYETVLLPSLLTLRSSTVKLLESFIEAGGTVLSAGDLPRMIDGVENDRIDGLNGRIVKVKNEPGALKQAIQKTVPCDLEVSARKGNAEDIWVHSRSNGDERIVFMANVSPTDDVNAEVRIKGQGTVEEWDCVTGDKHRIPHKSEDGSVVISLNFPPVGSHLLALTQHDNPTSVEHHEDEVITTVDCKRSWNISRKDPNALALDYCRMRRGEGEFTDMMPVLSAQRILTHDEYEGPVTLRYEFNAETSPELSRAVIEDAHLYDIMINNKRIVYKRLPYYVDVSYLPVDISGLVRKGLNTLDVSIDFRPLTKPAFSLSSLFENIQGVELEPVYIIGDFGVFGKASSAQPHPKCDRYAPEFTIDKELNTTEGDLVGSGYPFFAGTIILSTDVELTQPSPEERVILRLPEVKSCLTKVVVNNNKVGVILWPPYELDITDYIEKGSNSIQLELTNTLRNLQGPHHRTLGEPSWVWGENDYMKNDPDGWTDDYFFRKFGLLQKPVISYVVKR